MLLLIGAESSTPTFHSVSIAFKYSLLTSVIVQLRSLNAPTIKYSAHSSSHVVQWRVQHGAKGARAPPSALKKYSNVSSRHSDSTASAPLLLLTIIIFDLKQLKVVTNLLIPRYIRPFCEASSIAARFLQVQANFELLGECQNFARASRTPLPQTLETPLQSDLIFVPCKWRIHFATIRQQIHVQNMITDIQFTRKCTHTHTHVQHVLHMYMYAYNFNTVISVYQMWLYY